MSSIEITSTSPGLYAVVLDGTDISHALSGLSIDVQKDNLCIVKAELRIVEVTAIKDKHAQFLIPDETQALLKQLGWTPPHDGNIFEAKDGK